MVGEKLRSIRHDRSLSLQQVADKAQISAATLSRIENNKQALDVELMLALAKILRCRPAELLDDAEPPSDGTVANRIAQMDPKSRRDVWQELASTARSRRGDRKDQPKQLAMEVEELLAQIDFLRAEIESVKRRLKR